MGVGSRSIGKCLFETFKRHVAMTEQDSVIDWMWVLSKVEASRMIWTELWMGGGVVFYNRGKKRKLRKEIKKLRCPSGEVELAVELDIKSVSPLPQFSRPDFFPDSTSLFPAAY